MQKIEMPIDISKLRPSGIEGFFVFIADKTSDISDDKYRLNDTKEREFEIKCTLSKNRIYSDSIKCGFDENSGESFFLMAMNFNNTNLMVEEGNFIFSKNNKNELSIISFNCTTSSWTEALNKFFKGITPFLDSLSFITDKPVLIDKLLCIDKLNNLYITNYTTNYDNVTVNLHKNLLFKELFPIYSLYREAKNSISHYYRFLCYYKIMEGIFSNLRPELFKKAKDENIIINTKKEIVPEHTDLIFFKETYIGKSISPLFQKEFTSEYRNAVAHFKLDDGTLLNFSDYQSNAKFLDIIFLVEICAREVIKTQEDYYTQFLQGIKNRTPTNTST